MPNWEIADEAALAAADELRAALDSGVKFVKLKSGATADKYGSNPMRILPKHVNMISWFHPVPVHFIGSKSVGCVRLLSGGKQRCVGCEYAFEILKVDEKRGKKLLPGWSAYMNVLLLKPDGTLADNRVQVLSVRTGVLDQIRDSFAEKGDMSHPLTGRNINLKKKGENLNSEYIVQPSDQCPIPVDDLDALEVIDLTSVTEFLDDDGMRALIAGGGGKPGSGDAFAEEAAPPSRQIAGPGGFSEDGDEGDPGPSDDDAPDEPATPVAATVVPAGGFAEEEEAPAAPAKPAKAAAAPKAPKTPPAPAASSGSPAADALARLRAATTK